VAFSFSEDLSNDLSKVRSLIGDIDSSDVLLPDATISALLSQTSDNVLRAAEKAARRIARKFAREIRHTKGEVSKDAHQLYQHYQRVAERLADQRKSGAKPFAGGTSKDDKEARIEDSDRVPGRLSRDQFEHPDLS